MIKFETFTNIDRNDCSFCGQIHNEMVQMEEDGHAGAGNHFIMSRRCLAKFIEALKEFKKLHPSGVT